MAKTKEQKKALKELDLKQKKKFKINKTTLIVLAAILVVVGIWGVRYLIKYALYNGYEKYITDYDYVSWKVLPGMLKVQNLNRLMTAARMCRIWCLLLNPTA